MVYIVQDCGATTFVSSATFADKAAEIMARVPGITLRPAFGGAITGFDDYEAALATASDMPFETQPAGLDMQHTSGITGVPQGDRAPLPARQVTEPGDLMVAVFAPIFGFDEDTVYLSPAPPYHAAPLRFGGLIHAMGGTDVVMSQFEPMAVLGYIEEDRVAYSQWVPTMFVRMLKLTEEERAADDLSSMRVAVHAAAPCPVDVKQQMIDQWGPILHDYYAASAGITLIRSEDWLTHPGSVGRAGLGILHVCDEGDPDQGFL